MCKEVEKVLQDTPEISCTVVMDGETTRSDDFVAIMAKENGDTGIFYNTDVLTLGIAIRMVTSAFVNAMNQLPEEERKDIQEILGGALGE